MAERRRREYRIPVTSALVPFAPFLVAAFWYRWLGGLVVVALFELLECRRPVLELTEVGAVVRVYRRRLVPWESVAGVRSGGWLGGLVLLTRSYEEIRARAPCSWWGGPAPAEQVAEIEQWWVDHRGPSWSPTPPPVAPSPRPKPPLRYRTVALAEALGPLGLVVAAGNGAALWWPAGDFTVGFLEVTEPELDHLGWLILAAIAAGVALGAASAAAAHRLLDRGSPPLAAADARPGEAWRPLSLITVAGVAVAVPQWLGVAPGIGALTMVGAGVAVAIAAGTLAVAARRFEARTGRLLLSTHPLRRGLGLEVGPPV